MVPRWFLCLALLLVCPRSAFAEWHFTPMIGATFAGATTLVDLEQAADRTRKNFGGAVSLFGEGVLGVEGFVVWTPGFFERGLGLIEDSHATSLSGNVIITTPRKWTEYGLRPFVSAGYGLLRASTKERRPDALLPLSNNLASFNIGGGAVGFISRRTGLRFDFRYYRSLSGVGSDDDPAIGPTELRFMTASVGVVFRRGTARSTK